MKTKSMRKNIIENRCLKNVLVKLIVNYFEKTIGNLSDSICSDKRHIHVSFL